MRNVLKSMRNKSLYLTTKKVRRDEVEMLSGQRSEAGRMTGRFTVIRVTLTPLIVVVASVAFEQFLSLF